MKTLILLAGLLFCSTCFGQGRNTTHIFGLRLQQPSPSGFYDEIELPHPSVLLPRYRFYQDVNGYWHWLPEQRPGFSLRPRATGRWWEWRYGPRLENNRWVGSN